MISPKLNYIHQHPVRAGLVAEPAHYLYNAAGDYEGKKGVIAIDFLVLAKKKIV